MNKYLFLKQKIYYKYKMINKLKFPYGNEFLNYNCRFSLSRHQKILKNKIETILWQTLTNSNVVKDW